MIMLLFMAERLVIVSDCSDTLFADGFEDE